MRLIDASRAIGRVEEIPILTDKNQAFYEGCRYMQKRVLSIFHTSKTIDAVPVVRCKDCKHFETPYCMLCKTRIGAGYWSHDMAYRKPDDFCSYGKRKDGEG